MGTIIKNQPIKNKLILIILFTSTISLSLACAAIVLYDNYKERRNLTKDLSSISKLIADRSTAALTFQDSRLAEENLAALHVKPAVVAASIFNKQGAVFASYTASPGDSIGCYAGRVDTGYRFEKERFILFEPVVLEKERIGTVYICASLEDFNRQRRYYLLLMASIMAIATVIAFLLSSRLQTVISSPLLHLTTIAQQIARRKDYSLRAVQESTDEIGILVVAFNAMLAMIEQQNNERENLNSELERRVEARTAELVEARDRAEAADRLKSAFLATMSHELRTPLNSIIGFTGIILQGLVGELNDEQRKQLLMVRDSANHLLALINDVLDISKIEAGQLEMRCEAFALQEVIDKSVQVVRPLCEKKSLTIMQRGTRCSSTVCSDRRRVEQILLNLLSNAVKFTDRGGITLSVSETENSPFPDRPPEKEHRGTSTLRIVVTDTGIGIDRENLGKLFKPFTQIDTGTARRYDGTGLGLSISRKLAVMLGGNIEAYSDGTGKGTTFTFTLPGGERKDG